MPKKVTFDVTANTKGGQKGLTDIEKAAGKLHATLDRFGPVGKGIASILGKLGFSSVGAAAGLGVATAAIGAGVAIAEKSIDAYTDLVTKIDHYQDVTGQSGEASSRQVTAFKELGLSEDVAAAGMVKLSKAIETTPDKLRALGVEIVKNADGNVDLNGTLLNVIQAWQSMEDPAKRNLLVLTAFGKAGAALIPVLEANAAELKRLEDNVAKVVTQADIERVRSYKIAQKEAQQAADDWGLSLGEALLPAQKAVYDSLNENVYVSRHMDEELQKLKGSTQNQYAAQVQADRELRAAYRALLDAREATDKLAQSAQDAADAAQREADAENTLYDALHKSQDASFAYRQSLIDLKKAQKDATDAKGKDAEANLRLEEAYFAVSDAAVTLAEQQAEVNGTTLSAAQKVDIQVASLRNLEKGLDKNSPLYRAIQAYIALLLKVPAEVTTFVTAGSGTGSTRTGKHPGGGGQQVMDSGGMVTGGPEGSLVPVMARVGEEFSGYPPPNGAGGRGGLTVNIYGSVLGGQDLDRFLNEALRRARALPGT